MEEVLVFPSTHYMLRSEELLKRKGYALRLVPAPPQAGELCTTAIAIDSREVEDIVRYLEAEKILIKAVLPHERSLLRPLATTLEGIARKLPVPAALREILEGLRDGKQLEADGIAELLSYAESEEGEVVIETAEAAARAYFGNRVTALVGVRVARLKQCGSIPAPSREKGLANTSFLDQTGVEVIAKEMSRLGLVYMLLDLGELEEIPWSPPELKKALGENTIAVITASSLARQAGEVVREGAARQFLLRRRDLFTLDIDSLAGEVVFLRDNRPGPVGSGNLIPLLDEDLEAGGAGGTRRVRAVLAVCRLVLGDVFLPAPPQFWRQGSLAGANLLVIDAAEKPLAEAVEEVETRLREMGLTLARAARER
jgi:hypothetical protein